MNAVSLSLSPANIMKDSYFLVLFTFLIACQPQAQHQSNMESTEQNHRFTNHLINETSPYLLQHAHNPVNWYPWGEEALNKAKEENKLILVSIGYSACHWCHVMERESFENEEIAKIMNDDFVCIKVDREERPDIDQIYMNAVQLISGRGGWPLNCFALPDGRPFYGGTYYPPNNWKQLLNNISKEYQSNAQSLETYAQNLTEGIRNSELVQLNQRTDGLEMNKLNSLVSKWQESFDQREGGPNRAPKFPLPNNYQFLLNYALLTDNQEILDHVHLTLEKMALGGIYDQIGGGFARYSTDELWKAPHFEKMLYDNAQLISLYSAAYQQSKNELYKQVIEQSLEYIEREMTASNGAFYSALDADSEGEEGKFYVWNPNELQSILEDDFTLCKDYYHVTTLGKWEHGNSILLRQETDSIYASKNNLDIDELKKDIDRINQKLLDHRSKRIRPGLDDKTLTSWNALMIKGYADGYVALNKDEYLESAIRNAEFIWNTQRKEDGSLYHSYKNGKSTINGYLEDYCFTIEAFISLYETTFNKIWLNRAVELANYCMDHFFDSKSGMFYFTSDIDPPLVARKMEVNDNVIPASNSSLAKALFKLGKLMDDTSYLSTSHQMLKNVYDQMDSYGSAYSNWAELLLYELFPFQEIAITGKSAVKFRLEFGEYYLPNSLFCGSVKNENLPLLENKMVKGETTIYVCVNKACQLPVNEVQKAVDQILVQ